MRWTSVEEWHWKSPLTVAELRDRLRGKNASRVASSDFCGVVSDGGFQLTPIVSGLSSFLPRIIGRWRESSTGTRIDVLVAPNVALELCLVILFAFLGILVYDRNLPRVASITLAGAALAWLWLLSGHLAGGGVVERKLRHFLQAAPAARDEPPLAPTAGANWLSILGVTAVIVGGIGVWRQIYVGNLALTTRPAVDLVYVYWAAQAIVVGWLLWLSQLRPTAQFGWLLLLFALEIGWTWCLVVDGYAGDGRPILTWRWSPTLATKFPVADKFLDSAGPVDLSRIGPHDFAEFRGPKRDGVVMDLALDPDWAQSPPRILWQQPIGAGWSAFAVTADYAITQEQRGADEAVVCYELATGRTCWEHHDEALFHEMMGGDGPRATPTIHDGRVYALGATGILNCLDGHDGRAIWSVNVITGNSAPTSLFGMAGSPLVWRELVIVAPGGRQASVVAYDRLTGRRVWGAGDAAAAYASLQMATFAGAEQILCFNAEGLFAHAPDDGRSLWNIPWATPPERNNVCQPVAWIDGDGRETVWISSGYGKGCGLFEIRRDSADFSATPRWQNNKLQAKFSSVVARDGYVYGLDNNILCCLELQTGRRTWKGGRYGFGQLLLVGNHIVVLTDDGEIVLCAANPAAHRELARLPVLNGRTWNHPAFSGNRLLIRNDRLAACVELPLADR